MENTLKDILYYYIESFERPVLIHKAAIEEFAKVLNSNTSKKSNINSDAEKMVKDSGIISPDILEQAMVSAKSKYMLEYNNYDLEKIKQDLLFAPIATEYFNFIATTNGVNDILAIGHILSQLQNF